ncbi:cation transporter [Lujinxingia litoralis]|uniref:Cation transporter n=1 Tax=Lujinxingia litoralis TaxID=2211119 RepID=A0A328C9B4_9DELT|nr:cation diffusion facilitator family transporter [Lujinxingia litoralis]RAL21550.1 cation transporter [Lujinxingia litoralis]
MASPDIDRLANHRAVRRVLILTLGANLVVALGKLLWGYHANIVSLQADGFHSFFDALSNVIGLIALGMAALPPDREHPYGHQKLEVAASMAIGMMILIGLLEVGRGVWAAATGEAEPQVTAGAFGVILIAILTSFVISWAEKRAAKRYDSMILASDAAHTFSDALAGIAVLIGLILIQAGVPSGDIFAALTVMLFIGMTAYRVLRDGMVVLVDAALLDADAIRQVVGDHPEVRSCHYVRSRGMPGAVHLDLHVTVDPDMRMEEAGDVLLQIKDRLYERFPEIEDVLVQLEPHHPLHYEDVPENLV